METPNTIAHNLRRLRKAVPDLSQAELATRATAVPGLPPFEISQQYIADLEIGRNSNPNAVAVLRIAAVLDCQPADLYGVAPTKAVA